MSKEQSLKILLIDDEEVVHQALSPYLRDSGHDVDNAHDGVEALELIETNDYDLAFIDIRMPGMDGISVLSKIGKIRPNVSSIIITSHGNMEIVIQALRLGAADFLTKPIKLLELDAVLEKSVRIRHLRQKQHHLIETIRGIQSTEYTHFGKRSLIGNSSAISKIRKQIQMAVEGFCETILILGETGTGKEIVAQRIHFMSCGEESPFIPVNCPALTDSLAESELFGHVKGSFTGATMDRAGYFELADSGTLFLDEIGDLSPLVQAKLLRVLETRKLRRIGGIKEKDINIKVIAATNAPLEELVKSQKFRKDLFYRLNVFTISIPPLRERPSDIIPLAEHFLSIYKTGRGLLIKGISQDAREMLINYDYPGNARELRNIIERAAILCRTGIIECKHLNLLKIIADESAYLKPSNEEQERQLILAALEDAKWNRKKTAEALNIPYSTLRFKLSKLGIS